MIEKFYISNLYKISILILLVFISYGPVTALINGNGNALILIVFLFWAINLNFWINPMVVISKDLLIFRVTPYHKKTVIWENVKEILSLKNGSIKVIYVEKEKVRDQVLFPVNNQQRLIELVRTRIQ